MDLSKKKLAIVSLREADLDLIPAVVRDGRWELVVIADADAASVALKLGEIMRLPTTTSLAGLGSMELDAVVVGDPDSSSVLAQVLGAGVVVLTPEQVLAAEPAARPQAAVEAALGEAESKVLGSLADTLSLALDRQKLLRWILELAIECTGAQCGSIMLLDEKGQELRIAVAQGLSRETVVSTRQSVGEGIAGKVAREGKPMLISGVPGHELLKPGRDKSEVKAAMCVPLVAGGRVIGVLNVSSMRDPERFHEKDLHLLEKLAERVTDTLRRALEYSAVTNKTLEFTLREAAEDALIRDVPFPEKVQFLAASLAERVDADCYVYLPDKWRDGRLILYATSVKVADPALPGVIFGGKGFLGRALTSGKAQVLLPGGVIAPTMQGEDLGIICVPMKADRWHGLIVFDSVRVSNVEMEAFLSAFERVARFIGKELGREVSMLGLREQAEALAELNRVASSLMSAQKVEEVVRIIASEGARILRADACLVACEDGRGWSVDKLAGTEGVEEADRLRRAKELLMAECVKDMTYVSGEAADETLNLELERLGVTSFMAGPLRVGNRCLGACVLLRLKEGGGRPFNESESELFRSFCGYSAHGLERALVSIQAQQYGETDRETGLLGAQALLTRIDEESKRYDRYGIGFCITVFELEGLTGAFQRLGDQWRAAFLEEFSGGLRKTVREVDIAGRTGEAVFVVVSPQTPREGGAILRRVEELLRRLGAVRYVSPAPEVHLKGVQMYWPKDICDLRKASLLITGSVEGEAI
ncbi:MAG: GAF domain-containing protein [Candidatus Eisenbacteria bacterium]|nr:GAF domain-containing protein [Candidatus Eisenbacteria bacterium]